MKHREPDTALTRLWKRKPASTAVFLDTAQELRDQLIESHLQEFESKHGGDATHKGLAPEACSYCRTIQDHDEHHEAAKKDIAPKTIECRGRNGYFMLAQVSTGNIEDTQPAGKENTIVRLNLFSKAGYRDAAPIMIQGSHDAIEHLLLKLLVEVREQRAHINPL